MPNDENQTGPGLEPYKPIEGVSIGNFKNHPAYKPVDSAHSREEFLRGRLTAGPITDFCVQCHMASWNAGWWTDLKTSLPLVRNRGEMLMLKVSELCEAAEGMDYGLFDDKLPHRRMLEVELADFLIRFGDYTAGFGLDIQRAVAESEAVEIFNAVVHPKGETPVLFRLIRHVSDAMEGNRKSNTQHETTALARSWRLAAWYNDMMGMDVFSAAKEKMAFNANRADHKIENRMKAGGKAY
jgi:hypothetical protein